MVSFWENLLSGRRLAMEGREKPGFYYMHVSKLSQLDQESQDSRQKRQYPLQTLQNPEVSVTLHSSVDKIIEKNMTFYTFTAQIDTGNSTL